MHDQGALEEAVRVAKARAVRKPASIAARLNSGAATPADAGAKV